MEEKKDFKHVAILSNFTLRGFAPFLEKEAQTYGCPISIYEGAYGQWKQELMGTALYEGGLDLVFLLLDAYGATDDLWYSFHVTSPEEIQQRIDGFLEDLFQSVATLKQKTQAKIVLNTIPGAWQPLMGIVSNKQNGGYQNVIRSINRSIEERYSSDKQVFVFDFEYWLGAQGRERFWCDKYFYMADMHLSPEAFPLLAQELVSYIVPLCGKTKKCIVLDLDNTLWGGVVGEDGVGGIRLAPTGAGQQFYLFQKALQGLSKRGILLAINSKNNLADVQAVFKEHPYMVLKEDDFAAAQINWNNKAANMQQLAEDLNIGLDSFVFIDDDATNRALITEALPEVTVLNMPADSTLYLQTLLNYKGFNSFQFTEEDKNRGKMYLEDKKRREYKETVIDMDSFLAGLNTEIAVMPLSEALIPRAAQLTQKTNQFNLTTRRYQEEDLRAYMRAGARLWMLDATDKFGAYGITGFIIVKDEPDAWVIDTLLLSCRILGKKIEQQFIGYVLDELKKSAPKKIIGSYIPTKKNSQTKDFYQQFGFQKIKSTEAEDVWERSLVDYTFAPIPYIRVRS
jgi:FkbH-like protein